MHCPKCFRPTETPFCPSCELGEILELQAALARIRLSKVCQHAIDTLEGARNGLGLLRPDQAAQYTVALLHLDRLRAVLAGQLVE